MRASRLTALSLTVVALAVSPTPACRRQSPPQAEAVTGPPVVTVDIARLETLKSTVTGSGTIECRFPRLPLRPRQYILRLSITDSHQLASYDVVTAGPRFAVSGHGSGVEGLADEEDGLVSLPFEFAHHSGTARALHEA